MCALFHAYVISVFQVQPVIAPVGCGHLLRCFWYQVEMCGIYQLLSCQCAGFKIFYLSANEGLKSVQASGTVCHPVSLRQRHSAFIYAFVLFGVSLFSLGARPNVLCRATSQSVTQLPVSALVGGKMKGIRRVKESSCANLPR